MQALNPELGGAWASCAMAGSISPETGWSSPSLSAAVVDTERAGAESGDVEQAAGDRHVLEEVGLLRHHHGFRRGPVIVEDHAGRHGEDRKSTRLNSSH